MPADLLDLADRLWRGEAEGHHPLFGEVDAAEVSSGILFVRAFGNVTAIAGGGDLTLVDTGSAFTAAEVHRRVRSWSTAPLRTAVYSHGHIDHVFGLGPFEEEDADRPVVVAHEGVPARFERYRRTAGWNAAVNARQFGVPGLAWPDAYREPDRTYRDRLPLEVAGERLELAHARGETDDHTWTWLPDRRVLCPGDLFIWACPNAGNPQKVQRYPREWAVALRAMASLDAEVLLPGHGWPVVGRDRVREGLETTAALLEHLHDRTLEVMNAGGTLDDALHTVRAPVDLMDRPWLRPVYDDPEFVVRSVWRLYGGWWDGDPASLKPARASDVAAEVASLAGGARRLAERAAEVAAAGDLRLAGHLAGWAEGAAPDDPAIRGAAAAVWERRAAEEPSTMARGIFGWAARRARGEDR